jgi:hypothetical protein
MTAPQSAMPPSLFAVWLERETQGGRMLPDHVMKDLAFSVLRDFYHLSDADTAKLEPDAFVARLKGIHRGFNAEHEFAAIASWLGRCKLVAHPDELYATNGEFRVPDFLIVSQVNGHEVPGARRGKDDGRR